MTVWFFGIKLPCKRWKPSVNLFHNVDFMSLIVLSSSIRSSVKVWKQAWKPGGTPQRVPFLWLMVNHLPNVEPYKEERYETWRDARSRRNSVCKASKKLVTRLLLIRWSRSWITDRWPRLDSGPRLIWRRTEERKYFQCIGDVVVGETPTHHARCSME